MFFNNLAVLGCGNMGSAVVRGVIVTGQWKPHSVRIYDKDLGSMGKLAGNMGAHPAHDIKDLLQGADAVMIAVKPQEFPQIAAELETHAGQGQVIISIMAGLSSEKIKNLTGNKFDVVRTMPNLPLSVSMGATAIETDGLSEEILNGVEEIFGIIGETVRVKSSHMDAVTGLSGTGPMYLFQFVDALINAGIDCGLEEEAAYALAHQTVKGAMALLESNDETPEEWTSKVASKKGTTVAALEIMSNMHFREVFSKAVQAATNRSRELGSQ